MCRIREMEGQTPSGIKDNQPLLEPNPVKDGEDKNKDMLTVSFRMVPEGIDIIGFMSTTDTVLKMKEKLCKMHPMLGKQILPINT